MAPTAGPGRRGPGAGLGVGRIQRTRGASGLPLGLPFLPFSALDASSQAGVRVPGSSWGSWAFAAPPGVKGDFSFPAPVCMKSPFPT